MGWNADSATASHHQASVTAIVTETRNTVPGTLRTRSLSVLILLLAALVSPAQLIGQDCNSNGILDACDISCGTPGGACDVAGCGGSLDCDGNGVPDSCDIANCPPGDPSCADVNGDGVPDGCQFPTVVERLQQCGNLFVSNEDVIDGVYVFNRSLNRLAILQDDQIRYGGGNITTDADGNLLITEYENDRVQVVSPAGVLVRTITGGSLNGPHGAALMPNGNIAVCSYLTDSVKFYTADGTYLSNLSPNVSDPQCIAFDRAGRMYVGNRNSGNGHIAVFNENQVFVTTIGAGLITPHPTDMAFSSDEVLYVAIPSRIRKFSKSGTFLGDIVRADLQPVSLAFDETGVLWVTDADSLAIYRFSASDAFIDARVVDLGPGAPTTVRLAGLNFRVGPDADCDSNGAPDACDIESGAVDCDQNGIPDACELAGADCNSNGVLDTCEADCNGDGTPDDCEVDIDDCNANGVPDECDGDLTNRALIFDGNDLVRLPDSIVHANTTLTIEAWFNTTTPGVIFGYQNAAFPNSPSSYTPSIYVDSNGKLRGEIYQGSALSNITSTLSVNDGQWHHVALAGAVNTQTLYLDGAVVGTLAGSISHLNMTYNQIGMGYGSSNIWQGIPSGWVGFDGLIDDVRVWRSSRTQKQVIDNMTILPDEANPDLLGRWRFNTGFGQSAFDASASGNHGVLGTNSGASANDPAWTLSTSPDLQDDCNQNGILDECDIAGETSDDCNQNGIPDECEFGGQTDCDANGVSDLCDLYLGTHLDCNGTDIPDICELTENDCNANGIPDECELADNDCNANGIVDACDVDPLDPDGDGEVFPDCNGNDLPDFCETRNGDLPPNGAIRSPLNGNYYLLTSSMSWANAEAMAVSMGGHLVTIRDSLENQWLVDTFGPIAGVSTAYIGLTDVAQEGVWVWSSGEPLTFENWLQGEPNNNQGLEHFVEMYFTIPSGSVAGVWNDRRSSDLRRAIVEILGPADCNGNGVLDECDIASMESQDCNENGMPDECESGNEIDCDGNGMPDLCDLFAGTHADCNNNDVPDVCELSGNDCNGNGVPDDCELDGNDCNGNGVLDLCDLDPTDPDGDGNVSVDCNKNGLPDTCDIIGAPLNVIEQAVQSPINGLYYMLTPTSTTWANNEAYAATFGGHLATIRNAAENQWLVDTFDPQTTELEAHIGFNDALTEGTFVWSSGEPVTYTNWGSNQPDNSGNEDYTDLIFSSRTWNDNYRDSIGIIEIFPTNDCNGNGVLDECDIASMASQDCNGNGLPDECELGGVNDCDGNGLSDLCDVFNGTDSDCDGDGLPDACEVANGISDCNMNGVPDDCEPDCDNDGVLDACELSDGGADCNANGVLDECELIGLDASLEFDGVDDMVRVPRSPSLEPVNELTVEAWIRPDTAGSFHSRIVRYAGDFAPGYILAMQQSGTGQLRFIVSGSGGTVSAIDPASTSTYFGAWHHVAGVYSTSGGYCRIYVDGVLRDSKPAMGPIQYSNVDMGIGNYFAASNEDFDGLIDEVRIWSVARTQTDIADNMNLSLSGFESGLVGYWRFDEGEGQHVFDASPFANDGYLGNDIDPAGDLADPLWRISESTVVVNDCNANGVVDECDIASEASVDCNANGVPDECEQNEDCNANGVQDICDLFEEVSADCNNDLIPDDCQLSGNDCNANGIPDDCETGHDRDCDNNAVADLCDIHDGTHEDCNGNFIPDACDITSGFGTDVNANGVPDHCETDVRVIPVATLIDPAMTAETRLTLPDSITAVTKGSRYFVEVWASDVGAVNQGLTGVYVDVHICSSNVPNAVFHGSEFDVFPLGVPQTGWVFDFGGATFSNGVAVEPEWVRVGWIEMTAGATATNCGVTLLPSSNGVGTLGSGNVNPAFVEYGAFSLTIEDTDVSYDLIEDGFIGFADFFEFYGSWLDDVPPGDPMHDFDCDGVVGPGDLSWFATGWQKATSDRSILYPLCGSGGVPIMDTDVEVRVVLVDQPTPTWMMTNLPTSLVAVDLGESYYAELWASDVGDINPGFTSVYADVAYPAGLASVASVAPGDLWMVFLDGLDDGAGFVANLGGSTLPGGIGAAPEWVLVGRVLLTADAPAPAVRIAPQSGTTGIATIARGLIPWSAVDLVSAIIRQGLAGDINSDGVVDEFDVAAFVAVVVGNDTDEGRRVLCDFNGDATANGDDIHGFVATLIGI